MSKAEAKGLFGTMPQRTPMPPESAPATARQPGNRWNDAISLVLSVALLLGYGLLANTFTHSDFTGSYWRELLFASPLCLAFAAATWALRGATLTGAAAGLVIAVILRARFGNSMLATLIALFAVTWLATRIGYRRKQKLGVAEARSGRTGMQVLANLAPAAVVSIFYPVPWAVLAILAEVTADTVASELGQAYGGKPRLITTMKNVPVGSNGGITWVGTTCGILAAAIVFVVGVVGWNLQTDDGISLLSLWSRIFLASAIVGMIIDSVLGATLEGRVLNNDAVNFISASLAAVLGTAGIMIRLHLRL